MYARGTSLYAVPFDTEKVVVKGPPLPVLEGGMLNPLSGTANFEVSQNGILVYTPIGPQSGLNTVLSWMDRGGNVTPITRDPKPYDDARISPDNQKVALTIRAANDDVWVYDLANTSLTRLTFGGGNSSLPFWTPDGQKVLFFSERGKDIGIFWKTSDGSGTVERLGAESQVGNNFHMTANPDGKTVIYSARGDLWSMSLNGKHESMPILQDPFSTDAPRLSMDGNLLAYISDESGRNEVYVVRYPQMKGKWQISTGGIDYAPIWDPGGKELFFAENGTLMKVDVSQEPNVTFSTPQKICSLPDSLAGFHDVTRDGNKFLVTVSENANVKATELTMVLGWFTELGQKFSALKK